MRKSLLFMALAAALVVTTACGATTTTTPAATKTAVKIAEPTKAAAGTAVATKAPVGTAAPVTTQVPAATQPVTPTLTGTVWSWADTKMSDGKAITVPVPANYTLVMTTDGKLSAKADCNTIGGTYKVDGNKLTLTLGPSTRAACPPGSLSDEYIKELGQVATYLFNKSDLILGLKVDSGNMRFTTASGAAGGGGGAPGPVPTGTAPAGQATAKPVTAAPTTQPTAKATVAPAPPLTTNKVTINTGILGKSVEKKLLDDVTQKYVAFFADGNQVIRVIPVASLKQLASSGTVTATTDTLNLLTGMVAARKLDVQAPLPILPLPKGANDLACKVAYVDFAGGSGIRFVGRVSTDKSAVNNDQLTYFFQGLTTDGNYDISVMIPVMSKSLPDSADKVPADVQKKAQADFAGYMKDVTAACQASGSSDLTPTLAQLDAMVKSIKISK